MRTRFLAICLVCIGVFGLASCAQRSRLSEISDQETMPVAISAEQAKTMIDAGGVVVVDVRTENEYLQGHIRDAILVPNESISTIDNPDLLPDTHAVLLVYCRSGNRSAQAARKLVALGYKHVYDFGGIIDWPYDTVK